MLRACQPSIYLYLLRTSMVLLSLLLILTPALLAADSGDGESVRILANLTAFGRLYGYLRWFHPTDEAAAANWDHAALSGIQSIRHAKDDEELAQMLQAFFQDCAPTLRVFTSGNPVSVPAELRKPESEGALGLRMWVHKGLGTQFSAEQARMYGSQLEFVALGSDGVPPSGTPIPETPLRAVLEDGIEAWIAPTLYADSGGTYPRSAAPGETVFPSPAEPSHADLMVADAIVIWNVIQHFYPYPEVLEEPWDQVLESTLGHIVHKGDAYALTDLNADLLVPLQDGHAWLIPPLPNDLRVPELAIDWIEERLVVTYSGGEATAAGIVRGDILLSIDGSPSDTTFNERLRCEPGSPQERVKRVVRTVLAGPQGSSVHLTVAPADEDSEREVSLTRTQMIPFQAPAPETVQEIEPGILYIDVTRADDETLWRAREEVAEARGLILDARGFLVYPWSMYFAPSRLPSMQLRVLTISLPNHANERSTPMRMYTPLGRRLAEDTELAFLINAYAISAAELQLSFFAYSGHGTFIGQPTSGANGDINKLRLPSGRSVTWTGMIAEWSEDEPFHGIGILPDIEVHPTLAGVIEGRDEILEAAVVFLREKLGLP